MKQHFGVGDFLRCLSRQKKFLNFLLGSWEKFALCATLQSEIK